MLELCRNSPDRHICRDGQRWPAAAITDRDPRHGPTCEIHVGYQSWFQMVSKTIRHVTARRKGYVTFCNHTKTGDDRRGKPRRAWLPGTSSQAARPGDASIGGGPLALGPLGGW